MHTRFNYQGYRIEPMALPVDGGRYEARVAIIYTGTDRPRSQRFLDLETFPSQTQAIARGMAAGREWVDARGSLPEGAYLPRNTGFAELAS